MDVHRHYQGRVVMVSKYMSFFTNQPLPTKSQISVTLAQVFGLLANQMVGAIPASRAGVINDSNNPALISILLGDNQRGGAYPLFVRLVYPTGTEDISFPLHVTLTRGRRIIHTARRSAIVNGSGGRLADYEVVGTSDITVGTWPDGFASIGDSITVDLLFEAPPMPVPMPHYSYSIVAGFTNPWTGYWDARDGTINGENFDLPGGVGSREIRQTHTNGSVLRWLVRGNQGNRPQSNFPTRIVATNGANSVTVVPPDPFLTTQYGQGTGVDYVVESGSLSAVFVNDATIAVDLYYE